jgi:hypothetical protein
MSTIKYEIVNFYPETGSISVKYYTDIFTEGWIYNLDLNVDNGVYPSQEEINNLIEFYSPRGQIERIEKVKTAEVPDHLKSFIPSTSSSSSGDTNNPSGGA